LRAELPNPVLSAVFPTGVQAGTSTLVTVEGASPDGLRDLRCTAPGFTATKGAGNQFTISVPPSTPPGIYDLRAVTDHGLSSPRAFVISRLTEYVETTIGDPAESPTAVDLNSAVNGRIEKPGDVDSFSFKARKGDRVIIDCWAERIDSQLRGVIELYDAHGKRLAASRGHTQLDPRIVFLTPADGSYTVRVFDLSYLGSGNHFYRLDIDTLARPEFALPCVIQHGVTTRVRLFGYNLTKSASDAATSSFDGVEVEIAPPASPGAIVPLPQHPAHRTSDIFAYHLAAGHMPVAIGTTDVPVIENTAGHTRLDQALTLNAPCEVSAQLADGLAQHWYAVDMKRGEVFWLDAMGARIGSPVDLEISVLDPSGQHELVIFSDELENLAGYRFPTHHTDPAGRWLAPIDGRFLIVVRNVIGNSDHDPRRIYRLSVRREEPDFELAVLSRRTDQPAAWNVPRGGREWVEVLAQRRRGMTGGIRITTEQLPPGFECAETWIGPGQDRVPLVVTTSRESADFAGAIQVFGHFEQSGTTLVRRAHGGTMIWPGRTMPSGRKTQEIPLANGLAAPFVLNATPRVNALDQESVLEVDVAIESRGERPTTPVRLTFVGITRDMDHSVVTLPLDASKGAMSLFLPASLAPGKYTFAIQAEVEAIIALTPAAKPSKMNLTLISNPITIELKPARILLEVDPTTPTRIARGKISQLRFNAQRVQGFLGKVHVELKAPDGVVGLRARGVTLTGRTDSGSLQVIATDNAPLGKHLQLRLDAVGTVEDQPLYRASRYVDLEIVE